MKLKPLRHQPIETITARMCRATVRYDVVEPVLDRVDFLKATAPLTTARTTIVKRIKS
jgi:hypothetical protein